MFTIRAVAVIGLVLAGTPAHAHGQAVTFESLLKEMVSRETLARFPAPEYQSLQATSYNRESVHHDKPGWFADSDGTGFIREETVNGSHEWVIMEHDGPGAITCMWTPFFYMDLGNHTGPHVRVYLDGSTTPAFDESLITLLTGKGSIPAPLAAQTARAGDSYLPIPFAKSCKVTMTGKPFYYRINYRAYPKGTDVRSFQRSDLSGSPLSVASEVIRTLMRPSLAPDDPKSESTPIGPGASCEFAAPPGPASIRAFKVSLGRAGEQASLLRSVLVSMSFDDEPCVWCPLGDFFCSPDSIHPFHTLDRWVTSSGVFESSWVMPYRSSAKVTLVNLSTSPVDVKVELVTSPWAWDDRSMHFHASWRPDDIVPGTPFTDWNFIDITGKGVYVGDAWTILNPQSNTWWGEGDEKIYVDSAWDAGFPTHFGTGTEDYYGWAGGEIPTRRDEFFHPFLSNVRVGGVDGTTLGYNIVTRTRGLDAIPFSKRLRFDMESSFGTDIRNPWNHLGYSAVMFWYAKPGATSNRLIMSAEAAKPIMSLVDDSKNGHRVVKP